ncbi:hypothetical protein D3C74_487620 [compost metagenome]
MREVFAHALHRIEQIGHFVLAEQFRHQQETIFLIRGALRGIQRRLALAFRLIEHRVLARQDAGIVLRTCRVSVLR